MATRLGGAADGVGAPASRLSLRGNAPKSARTPSAEGAHSGLSRKMPEIWIWGTSFELTGKQTYDPNIGD